MKKIFPKKMGTHIKCQSIEKSMNFYTKLGFTPVFAYGLAEFITQFTCPTAPEKYCGVTFSIGNALFEIADGHVAVKQKVFQERVISSKISMMFDIDSVEELAIFARENNLEVAVPPRVFSWGTKEIVLRDPDGVILVFREVLASSAEAVLSE